jgi:hypothetical protein
MPIISETKKHFMNELSVKPLFIFVALSQIVFVIFLSQLGITMDRNA